MNIKKRIAFTLILLLVFNFLGSSTTFSETSFKAIGVKDNTKIISNQYESKNEFKYVKDGVVYTTPAFDFHIFSKEANLNAHTNGNIATKDLVTNAAFGTNQSTALEINEENYFMNSAQGINNIASDGNIIVGSNVPTSLEDNNNKVNIGVNGSGLDPAKSSKVYKETSESISYIDIDEELENLKIISSLFSNHNTSEGVTLSTPNGENQIINVDGNMENTNNYYLNVKASEISDGSNKRVLNIKIPERKTLIINVDMAGVNINYLQNLVTIINSYGNAEEVVKYENNILWNLYDSSSVDKLFSTGEEYAKVGTSDYFMGTILAPNANIVYGAVNGSIIANKTQQNGQESHKWSFTGHIYENKKVYVTIESTKTLAGKDLEADMFEFQLLNESNEIKETVKNDADGNIKFSPINFEKAGTYTYKIEEVNGKVDGITYDSQSVDVVITVTDNGEGQLEANVNYPNKEPVFINSYKAGSTSAAIEATKTLTGKTLEADMFSFQLLDKDGETLQTVKNDKDGIVQFEAIPYDTVGEYKYIVQEVNGNLDGVTYDEREFDVTVNVKDDGNGNLVATVNYPNNKIEFTNKYDPNSTSISIEATKTLIGKDLVSGMFSFKLLDDKGNSIEIVKNDENGKIKFSSLNFEKVGTYTYKIGEVNGKVDGITYDSQDVDVVITVTDSGEGQLEADVNYPNKEPVFINSYKAGSTSVAIDATKTLTGKTLEADMFSFQLLDKDGETLQTVKNDKDGIVQFEAIPYDTAGEYKYTVQEVKGNLNGITYDERVFDVTVNVTDDGNGNLVATVNYPNDKIEFTNKYKAKAISVKLEATKILTGKDLEADMFEFQLLNDNNEIKETVKNYADGNITFSSINFEKAGTYTYKIEEVNGKVDGITYDSQSVDVVITVTDNGEGKLEAEIKYPNKEPVFNNSYRTGTTSAVIEATKKLIGKDLASGIFSFELLDKEGKLVQTVKNNLDGKVKFAAITYDSVGDYEYTIREVQGNLEGVIYDKSTFEVLVTVQDDGNGNLVAKVVYSEDEIIFENKIIQGSLEIIKTDAKNGKHIENVEFTIRDSEDKVVALGKTDKNGKVVFEGLKYGKYTYQETVAPKGYIIDNKKYSFEIKEDGVVVKYTMTNKRKSVVPSKTNTPNTGDTGIATAFIIGLLGVGGLFVNNKRKIKNKNL
jgi:pilin isopeptide linkage protein